MKNYVDAKKAFAAMKMNEYQITYLAYNLMNKAPLDLEAVKSILDVALEQHPNSSIVYSRWGDYFLKRNDKQNAIKNYQRAIELDPSDENSKELLKSLL
jgi:tetratricopeptide (TPR) repeat protein